MKMSHKINHDWVRPTADLSDRYLGEIERTLAKAAKAWREAEKRLVRAELAERKKPSPETRTSVEELRVLVCARLDELNAVAALMQGGTCGRNWSGTGSAHIVNNGRVL